MPGIYAALAVDHVWTGEVVRVHRARPAELARVDQPV